MLILRLTLSFAFTEKSEEDTSLVKETVREIRIRTKKEAAEKREERRIKREEQRKKHGYKEYTEEEKRASDKQSVEDCISYIERKIIKNEIVSEKYARGVGQNRRIFKDNDREIDLIFKILTYKNTTVRAKVEILIHSEIWGINKYFEKKYKDETIEHLKKQLKSKYPMLIGVSAYGLACMGYSDESMIELLKYHSEIVDKNTWDLEGSRAFSKIDEPDFYEYLINNGHTAEQIRKMAQGEIRAKINMALDELLKKK